MHLKKSRRAEGDANNFGVFRVKNHDFTTKNHIFSNCGGRRENFGVFRVKNHDFKPKNLIFPIAEGGAKIFGVFRVKNHDPTPKKNHIFSNFRGARAECAPLDPPLNRLRVYSINYLYGNCNPSISPCHFNFKKNR